VDVVFTVCGQVIVDDEGDLLDVDTTGPDVGGDEDTAETLAEVGHDRVTLLLVHLTVHCCDGKVVFAHLLREPLDLGACVAEDDGLGDGERVVEIAQCVKLPFFLLDRDKELHAPMDLAT